MTAQIQARLWPLWSKTLNANCWKISPSFYFSDFEYKEMVIPPIRRPFASRQILTR